MIYVNKCFNFQQHLEYFKLLEIRSICEKTLTAEMLFCQ